MPKPIIAALVAAAASLSTPNRRVVELLAKNDGAGAAALLTAQRQAKLPPGKLSQIWQGLVTQAGAFR
jgi:hypothetical protein